MTAPIIPWLGGKRRLADRLIPLFPPHECYVEVFAGGAALYFLRPQAAPVEALNDITGDSVTLYRVVQNHLDEVVRQLKCAPSSRQVAESQRMARPLTCGGLRKTSRPPGSVCPAPTWKTCLGWNAPNATTVPTPSITWTRLTGRPPATAWTFRSKITSGWPILCVAVKAR